MRKVFGFTIAAVMPFIVAGALLTLRGVTTSLLENRADALDETPLAPPAPATMGDDEEPRSLDLLGNPVTDAVAKYKFDATGSLYELHSPQTELPRLASPKS